MMYLLDTNVCVQYLRGKNSSIRDRLANCQPTDIRLYALCDSFPCSALFSASSAFSAVNLFVCSSCRSTRADGERVPLRGQK
jgi:predicted nucleic acid-binding protein